MKLRMLSSKVNILFAPALRKGSLPTKNYYYLLRAAFLNTNIFVSALLASNSSLRISVPKWSLSDLAFTYKVEFQFLFLSLTLS